MRASEFSLMALVSLANNRLWSRRGKLPLKLLPKTAFQIGARIKKTPIFKVVLMHKEP